MGVKKNLMLFCLNKIVPKSYGQKLKIDFLKLHYSLSHEKIKFYSQSKVNKIKYNIFTPHTLLEKWWRILLYLTDEAIAMLYIYDVKFRHIEGNGRKVRHIELSNCAIS